MKNKQTERYVQWMKNKQTERCVQWMKNKQTERCVQWMKNKQTERCVQWMKNKQTERCVQWMKNKQTERCVQWTKNKQTERCVQWMKPRIFYTIAITFLIGFKHSIARVNQSPTNTMTLLGLYIIFPLLLEIIVYYILIDENTDSNIRYQYQCQDTL